jgi:hypothetical protein
MAGWLVFHLATWRGGGHEAPVSESGLCVPMIDNSAKAIRNPLADHRPPAEGRSWGRRSVSPCRVPAGAGFWYPEKVRSSVSIALFFLLSGLFLSLLLGAIEHSRKLLAVAGGCLVAVVLIIVLLTPVQLPNLGWWNHDDEQGTEAATGSTTTTTVPPGSATTSTVASTLTTVGVSIFIPRFTVPTFDSTATTGVPIDGRY